MSGKVPDNVQQLETGCGKILRMVFRWETFILKDLNGLFSDILNRINTFQASAAGSALF